uniref:Uncharacterized protein n=1 Tax=Anguilla anguilla TaxID=7936 RepID=A0A0E9UQF1_ANGAN
MTKLLYTEAHWHYARPPYEFGDHPRTLRVILS